MIVIVVIIGLGSILLVRLGMRTRMHDKHDLLQDKEPEDDSFYW